MKVYKHIIFSLTVILIFFSSQLRAQVIQAEYFIDTDPGEGFGTLMEAEDGAFNSVVESIIKTGVSFATEGLHTLNVRVQDNNGDWGPVFTTVVYATAALDIRDINVDHAELFWDTDPGEGSGVGLLALDGTLDEAIETVIGNNVFPPGTGVHTLNIRVRGPDGDWGPVFSTVVNVEDPHVLRDITVQSAEFFWGADPGEGSGTAMVAFDGAFDNAIETVVSSDAAVPGTAGVELFSIRVQGGDDNWGPVFSTVIEVEEAHVIRDIDIVQAELYWDTDPGEGNGAAMIAFDGALDEAIETVINHNTSVAPPIGLHTLNVRVKGKDDLWGPVFTTIIEVEDDHDIRDISITEAELYWDTDPGEGSGTALIAFDGAFDQAIEAVVNSAVTSPSVGMHTLNVRVKDDENNWGPVFTTVVNARDVLDPRDIAVTAAELYWDTDPGEGNGMAMLAFDGDFDQSIEAVTADIAFLPDTGFHILHVRVQDMENNWGPPFRTVIHIMPCITEPEPVITANGDTMLCPGDSVQLVADAGYSEYTWFKGSTVVGTGQSYYAKESGFYNVYVLDGNGCPGWSDYIQVVEVSGNPVITPSGPTEFCEGGSVMLDAGSDYTGYLWSNGETTQQITIYDSGDYSVEVSITGCSFSADPVTVTVNPLPLIPLVSPDGPTTFCIGGSVTLTSTAENEYMWSNGETTQAVTVSATGTYNVTVTNTHGCQNYSTGTSVVASDPSVSISPSGTSYICEGDSVELTATSAETYLWVTGETSQSIYADTAGDYTVSITDSIGCPAASAPVTVVVDLAPDATLTITGETTFCLGDSVILSVPGCPTCSILWNNGDTTDTTVIYTSGTYTATVESQCATVYSDPVTVTVIDPPTAVIVPVTSLEFCDGDSITLNASGGDTYLWSNGSTDASVVANATGDYWLIATNACGTDTSDTVHVIEHSLPTADIYYDGSLDICVGDTVDIWTDPAAYYSWSNGANAQSIEVHDSGTFMVTITDDNGCTAVSPSVTVTSHPLPVPGITASDTTVFCDGDSVILGTDTFADYLWSNGDTTQETAIYESGNYTVTVTDDYGCVGSSSSEEVTVLPLPMPAISAGGPTTFCEGDSVTLTCTSAITWLWSTGDTAQSITVYTSDDYTVSVTNSAGCMGVATPVTVTVNPNPEPEITADGPVTFCQGDTVTLTSSDASQYLWSTNDQTQSIDVYESGSFVITVTDQNGCTGVSDTTTVTVYDNPLPVIYIDGPNVLCEGDSATLSTDDYTSYIWSTGETSQSIVVYDEGIYEVTVTSDDGCTGSSGGLEIFVYPLPEPVITESGDTLYSTVAYTYQWYLEDSLLEGETSQYYVPPFNGSYLVEVTDSNGCTAMSDPFEYTLIEELGNEGFELNVYPNPFTEYAIFEMTLPRDCREATFVLYDMLGKMIVTIPDLQSGTFRIEKGAMAPGVYAYRIYNHRMEPLGNGKLIVR